MEYESNKARKMPAQCRGTSSSLRNNNAVGVSTKIAERSESRFGTKKIGRELQSRLRIARSADVEQQSIKEATPKKLNNVIRHKVVIV